MKWELGFALALGGFTCQWLIMPLIEDISHSRGFLKGCVVFFVTMVLVAILNIVLNIVKYCRAK